MVADFTVNFHKVVKSQASTSSGKIFKTVILKTIPPFTLEPGHQIEIYARNYSWDAFAEVLLPKVANGQIVGTDRRVDFKLALGRFGGFYLHPWERKPPS
jgi:hypothetical protein